MIAGRLLTLVLSSNEEERRGKVLAYPDCQLPAGNRQVPSQANSHLPSPRYQFPPSE
jgi:hypothetical protein